MFEWVDETPLGSASIAQIHRATTVHGDDVVLKVVKPGVRELLRRDATLLRLLARGLQLVVPRYMPRRIIDEFTDYTLREVDLHSGDQIYVERRPWIQRNGATIVGMAISATNLALNLIRISRAN